MNFAEFQSSAAEYTDALKSVSELVTGPSARDQGAYDELMKLQSQASNALLRIDHVLDRHANRTLQWDGSEVDTFTYPLTIFSDLGCARLQVAIGEINVVLHRLSRLTTERHEAVRADITDYNRNRDGASDGRRRSLQQLQLTNRCREE